MQRTWIPYAEGWDLNNGARTGRTGQDNQGNPAEVHKKDPNILADTERDGVTTVFLDKLNTMSPAQLGSTLYHESRHFQQLTEKDKATTYSRADREADAYRDELAAIDAFYPYQADPKNKNDPKNKWHDEIDGFQKQNQKDSDYQKHNPIGMVEKFVELEKDEHGFGAHDGLHDDADLNALEQAFNAAEGDIAAEKARAAAHPEPSSTWVEPSIPTPAMSPGITPVPADPGDPLRPVREAISARDRQRDSERLKNLYLGISGVLDSLCEDPGDAWDQYDAFCDGQRQVRNIEAKYYSRRETAPEDWWGKLRYTRCGNDFWNDIIDDRSSMCFGPDSETETANASWFESQAAGFHQKYFPPQTPAPEPAPRQSPKPTPRDPGDHNNGCPPGFNGTPPICGRPANPL